MSLAMYACPYDSPPPMMSSDFEKNDTRSRKTTRPKTQKNHSEKVNDVLLSINEETLADFQTNENDEVNIEEIKTEYKGVSNFHKNIIPSYIETSKPIQPEPDPLLNKVNYIIGLLENQQDEKLNNISEDLIIYALLGCFIIFIIDKFVSVGKYVR
jgi:hypothetical protein